MSKIIVIGLGPGDPGQLMINALELMKNASRLILRTSIHPTVDYIDKQGIQYTTCDDLYNKEESFDVLYDKISDRVIEEAKKLGEVVYAVPGHPLVAEKSVQLILQKAADAVEVEILPAMSFIDAILSSLAIDPVNGLKILDGLSLDTQKVDTRCGNIITQVYDRYVASDVKLKLMDYYPDDYKICIIKAAGVKGTERIEHISLYELDRIEWVDYLTSLYIPPAHEGGRFKDFDDLLAIMERLRADDGCPWDKEQTHETLKQYLLEETYEVLDAIEKDDVDLLVEELGDLLLQVVFHAQIGKDEGTFDIRDVSNNIVEKLTVRHPHVFGDVVVTSESGALKSWEASKRKIKGIESYTQTLEDIPQNMPALMRSYKVGQKAALSGFDWDIVDDAFAKVEEEVIELKEVYKTDNKGKIEEEIGDLLFAVVNVARFLKIQPELALKFTTEKFIRRFRYIEETAVQKHVKMNEMTLKEMDKLWEEAKNK